MATNPNRVGGTIYIRRNGKLLQAKGKFEYHLGVPKRDTVLGASEAAGYSEKAQVAYIEGAITDKGDLDMKELQLADGDEITLEAANGKVCAWHNAWYAGPGTIETEEGESAIRFESKTADEILAA
jgi:hypothetical protein